MTTDASARAWSTRRLIALLMGGALISKILGFARELLMAQLLGASLVADAYRGAATIVCLPVMVFLANESVSTVLIPIQRDAQRNGDSAQRLAAIVIAFTLAAVVLMGMVQATGPWWVDAVVGGFVPEGRALTLEFIRIMVFAMPGLVMLSCLAAGEIAMGRARLTNIRQCLMNLCIMFGLVFLALTGRVDLLAWAFTISFNALAGWGLWSLWRERHLSFAGMTPAMVLAATADVLRRLRPLAALPFAEQANIWIERVMASRLGTGAVASLDYARTLTESALLLVGQPVGLTVLSSQAPQDQHARIEAIARPILAVGLPVSVFAVMFAPDIVRLVFHRGAFNETGVLLTTQALRGMAAGMWASTLGWILVRILNSSGRNARAAVILAAACGMNIAVNLATPAMQEAYGVGLLTIGLGDAVRGLVVLAGTIVALRCTRRFFVLLSTATGPAALMGVFGWLIHQVLAGMLLSLLAGGLACMVCVTLAIFLLMPGACQTIIGQLRNGASMLKRT